ncbi:MAG: NYN domain-containing protein [Endomicrobiia bacterium]|nr:NYN domain-containing protein [Endomicrobiia bacterium]
MSGVVTHYIIDGSNLLYFSDYVAECGDDVILARQELSRALAAALGENDGSAKNCGITIVYDVHSWIGPTEERVGEVKIIFAVGPRETQPADREILSLIERRTPSDEELVLVSDDNSLRREAMYFGCRPMSCEKFWKEFSMGYR